MRVFLKLFERALNVRLAFVICLCFLWSASAQETNKVNSFFNDVSNRKGVDVSFPTKTSQTVKSNIIKNVNTEFFKRNEKSPEKLDAIISKKSLRPILQQLSAITGWRVFLEPRVDRVVNVKFKGKEPYQLLPLILGDINYALVSDGKNEQKLLVFRTARGAATEFLAPDLSKPIPNELIVILKSDSKLTPEQIATMLNGRIIAMSKDKKAIRFRFENEDDLAKAKEMLTDLLKGDDSVASVQNNYYAYIPEMSGFVSGLSGLYAPTKVPSVTGSGDVTIAMIDSAPHSSETTFESIMLSPVYFTEEGEVPLSDIPTHADSMMGSITELLLAMDVAEDIRYQPLVVLDSTGYGDTFSLAQALIAADEAGLDIINMSLCSTTYSKYLDDVVGTLAANGRILVAAAGNDASSEPTYPASLNGVIAVTASDRSGALADYANYGNYVDAITPGTGVFSYDGSHYITTGTSVSSAYFSAMLAAGVQKGQTPAEIRNSLLQKLEFK